MLATALKQRERLVTYAQRVLKDRDEAEDVVQEVLLKLSRARLRDPQAARGWLFAATYRQAVDRLRSRERRGRAMRGLALTSPGARTSAGAGVACDLELRDEARRARLTLAELDDPYRTALRLRYLEGLGFPEIAARMSTLERTARTWVGRGLTRLRRRLDASK